MALLVAGLAVLWAAALGAPPARADSLPLPGTRHIATQLVAEEPARPGHTVWLALAMQPASGWHGYWLNPGDAGFGMKLGWQLPAGVTAGAPRYPVPETLLVAGLMNHVFLSDYALLVPLQVPASAAPGSQLAVGLVADYLACTETTCVPEQARLALSVPVAATGAAAQPDPRFALWRSRLPAPLGSPAAYAATPAGLSLAIPLPANVPLAQPHLFLAEDGLITYAGAQRFARKGDTLVITLARPAPLPGAGAGKAVPGEIHAVLRLNRAGDGLEIAARPGPVPADATPLADDAAPHTPPLALLLLAALAGGLLLNIMPCVFPILSLKALSLARAGESAADARHEGLAYTAGTVVACVALGATMLALRAAGEQVGWAFQLQHPLVVAALMLLAVAITANLAGLFELAVPGFVGNRAGVARGAFASGLLAAFAGTPCTGPFMAGAMGAALLLPVGPALGLFAALGLGMALPFLAIALVPPLRARLPRPGGWMNSLRRLLALPMGLTALGLAWLASRLAGDGFALALAGLAAGLLLALALIGRRQRRGLGVARPAVGLGAALAGAVALALPHAMAAPDTGETDMLGARPYSESTLAAARAQGPVFAYFTADWCLSCKVNERVAIETDATRAAFAKAHVTVIKGDWTRRDPAITRYLAEQGAAGVPLYVWYGRHGAGQALPQVLTPDTLPALARGQ